MTVTNWNDERENWKYEAVYNITDNNHMTKIKIEKEICDVASLTATNKQTSITQQTSQLLSGRTKHVEERIIKFAYQARQQRVIQFYCCCVCKVYEYQPIPNTDCLNRT